MRCKCFNSFRLPVWLAAWFAATVAVRGLSVADLQTQLDRGEKLTVIDIRSPQLFAQGHIPGAINVPVSLCAPKRLPPLGKIVVCGEGLGRTADEPAVSALAAKPGITLDVLDGGFAAWESAQAVTTRGRGLRPEALNYITYADLKAAKADRVVLVDLRKGRQPVRQSVAASTAPATEPLTDLTQEFPGMPSSRSPFDLPQSRQSTGKGPSAPPLLVLIDDEDGTAQAMARKLKANGLKRYVILAGGELILARHGQAGLQRSNAGSRLVHQTANSGGQAH